jgi:hypothetical protein
MRTTHVPVIRRAYDRSLGNTRAPGRPSAAHYPHWSYETRRRGATHAWESHRRPIYHKPHPKTHQPSGGSASADRNAPYPSHRVRRATGKNPNEQEFSQADRVRRESSLWRAVQVIGIVVIISGGLRAITG